MKKRLRLAAIIFFVCVAGIAVLAYVAGEMLGRAAHRVIGNPPAALGAETVNIAIGDGGNVSGWLARGDGNHAALLLLHGVRSDRRSMIGRAEFLHRLGYSVMLIDLPAHGQSSGEYITFGRRESAGVDTALAFLSRQFPSAKIGVIGVSLGAASLVFSHPLVAPGAVVLESMYPSIEEAVANRLNLHLGAAGEWLATLLVWQLPWRLGISAQQLRPIDSLAAMKSPLFIIAGAADRHTTPAETLRIFAAAPMPRQLWIVDGAAHVDLHAFATAAYEEKIAAFFAAHLPPETPHPSKQ